MSTVSINGPKTPVTEGSNGVAAATTPNVCKMPGPPAPFVPTPLPNIGRSGLAPKGYSTKVTIEGSRVAVRGATFGSTGDIAAQATGGGMLSNNVEGPTKFVGPGSINVFIEGKNVQLLSDPMLNNCGPSGTPPNAATMVGVLQDGLFIMVDRVDTCPICRESHKPLAETKDGSKAAAQELATKLKEVLEAELRRPDRRLRRGNVTTMLAVTQGLCGKRFAEQSTLTYVELCDAATRAGLHHRDVREPSYFTDIPPAEATDDEEARLQELAENRRQDALRAVALFAASKARDWRRAIGEAEMRFQAKAHRKKRMSPYYLPGGCAGPKAIALALEGQCGLAQLTEQWFSDHYTNTRQLFRFAQGGEEGFRRFAPGESVPPCSSCDLLLPVLLCIGSNYKCEHV